MRVAYHYITDVLGFEFTLPEFKEKLFTMWFKLHPLHFPIIVPGQTLQRPKKGRKDIELPEVDVEFCAGFEHVFLGETEIHEGDTVGVILGYHYWLKFFLDEIVGRVNYLGSRYHRNSHAKLGAPFVELKFRWYGAGQGQGSKMGLQGGVQTVSCFRSEQCQVVTAVTRLKSVPVQSVLWIASGARWAELELQNATMLRFAVMRLS